MILYIADRNIRVDNADNQISYNSDYIAEFHFDEEWNGKVKTARFVQNGEYSDVVLIDDRCEIPPLKTGFVRIGVFSDSMTSTYADVYFKTSIKDGTGIPTEPSEDVYAQLTALIESGMLKGKDGLTPYVGSNNNWWIGDVDIGIIAHGYTPVKGVDYFTDSEVKQIQNEVSSGAIGNFKAVVDAETETFNNNAETKFLDYNSNSESKVAAYNQNDSEKTEAYNNNAQAKVADYNTNADNRVAEFNAQTEQIQTDISGLKSDLTQFTGNERYENWIDRKVYKINTDPINLTPYENKDYRCMKIACSENDVFLINGGSLGVVTNLWAFVSSTGEKLEYETHSVTVKNKILTAPPNTAYLLVNWRTDINGNPNVVTVISGKPLVDRVTQCERSIKTLKTTEPLWEMGGLDIGFGTPIDISTRIRTTSYINPNITNISAKENYLVILYAYHEDGTYKGVWDANNNTFTASIVKVSSVDITTITAYKEYKYKVVLCREDNGDISTTESINATFYPENIIGVLENAYNNIAGKVESEYNLPYNSASYYVSKDNQELVSTYSGVISLYDALVIANPNYISKNTLTSGTFSNYEYVFSMGNYNEKRGNRNQDAETPKPVILIMTGVHGHERCSVMGLYLFAKALCESPAMSAIRDNYVFKLIPIVCPSGYDANDRVNSNGVNINRNFDADWVLTPADGNNYSGASPADQPETQVIQTWMDANTNALIAIDWHNSGYTDEVSYFATCLSNGFAPSAKKGYFNGVAHIIGHLAKDRKIVGNNIIYSYTGISNDPGYSTGYGKKIGLSTALLETSLNVGDYGKDTNATIGVNAEVICAVIKGICQEMNN